MEFKVGDIVMVIDNPDLQGKFREYIGIVSRISEIQRKPQGQGRDHYRLSKDTNGYNWFYFDLKLVNRTQKLDRILNK